MILLGIGILVAIAAYLVRSIFAARPEQSADNSGVLAPWTSDYKQLRIEYHQSIDRSQPPPDGAGR